MANSLETLFNQIHGQDGFHIFAAIAVVLWTSISVLVAYQYVFKDTLYPGFGLAGREEGEKGTAGAAHRFLTSGAKVVREGLTKYQEHPFQVISSSSSSIVLPQKFMDEVKNDDRLSFAGFLSKAFFTNYSGFEGMIPSAHTTVFPSSVRLGASLLNRYISPLAEDTAEIVPELFPPSKEWRETQFRPRAAKIIARLSARAFLGEELSKNEEWLNISVDYTVHFFTAAWALREWSPILRPIVQWFLPELRQLRKDAARARTILGPRIAAHKAQLKDQGAKKGPQDAFDWMDATAKKLGAPIDLVNGQLNYTIGAVHTTSNTVVNALYEIAAHPEYMSLLREEIASVLEKEGGWTKKSLDDLKMLDSCMKESQRLHPSSIAPINRAVNEPVKLSDGTQLPRGARVMISSQYMTDAEYFENPTEFIGRRFYDLRQQPGQETSYQFVSTSNEFNVFGHGKHACPGRFFASNEVKIILSFLLMKYDWKILDNQKEPSHHWIGVECSPNSKYTIMYKSRTPELELEKFN